MVKTNICDICGSPVHSLSHYCKRCRKLIDRVDVRGKVNKKARVKALKDAWDGEGFRCYYTGVRLEEKESKHPLYLTFDHRIPGNQDDIVVTSQVINDMKSDLSEEEFRKVVIELAKKFQGGEFNPDVLRLKYWRR